MPRKSASLDYTPVQLARAAGVSTDTLRHYESKSLIPKPPRSTNGYRTYPADTLGRVQLIRRALGIGFTIDELARILRSRDRGEVPCAGVRGLAARKLGEVETRVKELTSLRDSLKATLREWDARLAGTPPRKRAGLLELLAPRIKEGGLRSPAFSSKNKQKKAKQ
jgi:DNA-binding transcriptional MerR regulator